MFVCTICGFVYNPATGDPHRGIEPGTEFPKLPENWVCPRCGARKHDFVHIENKPHRK